MQVATIPKNLIQKVKDDLVIIPRREYQKFLAWKKETNNNKIAVSRLKSFKVPKKHEKFYKKIDQELTESLKEVEQGKVAGPFNSAEELMNSLK